MNFYLIKNLNLPPIRNANGIAKKITKKAVVSIVITGMNTAIDEVRVVAGMSDRVQAEARILIWVVVQIVYQEEIVAMMTEGRNLTSREFLCSEITVVEKHVGTIEARNHVIDTKDLIVILGEVGHVI